MTNIIKRELKLNYNTLKGKLIIWISYMMSLEAKIKNTSRLFFIYLNRTKYVY